MLIQTCNVNHLIINKCKKVTYYYYYRYFPLQLLMYNCALLSGWFIVSVLIVTDKVTWCKDSTIPLLSERSLTEDTPHSKQCCYIDEFVQRPFCVAKCSLSGGLLNTLWGISRLALDAVRGLKSHTDTFYRSSYLIWHY